ncbi:putative elongation factor 1 gamma-containing protein [Venustampulla echinocandica]|uniref:Putative elongation factor 1 gamma-containing protein n=1 Tax=Venustampulla echinocandica TaxID=2656787 RepID=A0A370TAQ8_9HELO|nr:putative elongation factor 1 gamma-containing protein [Venustampulla echinocandica]RDL31024.1 putative elongation factor 1 gamma-containing protein [Venustampulla echinocandica]
MVFGTIYTFPGDQPRTIAIKAVAKANGLDLDVRETPRTPEHLSVSKLGKVPAFEGADGFKLFESIAIALYLTSQDEQTTLLGSNKKEYAEIIKWMSFFNSEILIPMSQVLLPLIGIIPYQKEQVEFFTDLTQKAVDVVEEHLQNIPFLVGERLTLADLFCAGNIALGFQFFYGKTWRQANPNTSRWYETICHQPIYAAVTEMFQLLDEPKLTNVPPEKKPEIPQPAAEASVPDAPPADAPKPKHPIEALPKPTFPLDEWKRYYSNNVTGEAMKYFWDKVTFEEYSIWRCDYKYNNELTLTFMSNNLIGGLNARLEASRKYMFGSASVYGQNHDSVIQGAFVIRGQEYQPIFDVAPDYECYEFTKLDPSNAEDRDFVEAQWTWDKPATVNGKEYKHADGKVFK